MATYRACEIVGLPECGINLSHCVVALAEWPKSTRSYRAWKKVLAHVESDTLVRECFFTLASGTIAYPQCTNQAHEGSGVWRRVPLRATVCPSRTPRVLTAAHARYSVPIAPSRRLENCTYTRDAGDWPWLVPASVPSGGAIRGPRSPDRVGADSQPRRALGRPSTNRGTCSSEFTPLGVYEAAIDSIGSIPAALIWRSP